MIDRKIHTLGNIIGDQNLVGSMLSEEMPEVDDTINVNNEQNMEKQERKQLWEGVKNNLCIIIK